MTRTIYLVSVMAVILLTVSCRSVNKPDAATQIVSGDFVTVVDNGNINYSDYFIDKTMRFDYFHSGTATEEHFAKDRIVSDGIWSGSRRNLLDDLKLGLYFFEVIDKESKILLYSHGFASIFGEWQTIPEAG